MLKVTIDPAQTTGGAIGQVQIANQERHLVDVAIGLVSGMVTEQILLADNLDQVRHVRQNANEWSKVVGIFVEFYRDAVGSEDYDDVRGLLQLMTDKLNQLPESVPLSIRPIAPDPYRFEGVLSRAGPELEQSFASFCSQVCFASIFSFIQSRREIRVAIGCIRDELVASKMLAGERVRKLMRDSGVEFPL